MVVLDHDELLLQVQELEPLPISTTHLARLVADPNSELSAIVEVMSLDPALTARVLGLANSAASGAAAPIATVEQAVVRLGTGAVLSMAVAAGVRSRMASKASGPDTDDDVLWRHSVASALAAESMTGLVSPAVPPETFTAALLHDVGQLVLRRYLAPEVERFLRQARAGAGLDATGAESAVLAVDHAELGSMVAQHWKMPESICLAIRHHHDPAGFRGDAEMAALPRAVHLADLVARHLGRGLDDVLPDEKELEMALAAFGLDEVKFEKLLIRTSLRFEQIAQRFG